MFLLTRFTRVRIYRKVVLLLIFFKHFNLVQGHSRDIDRRDFICINLSSDCDYFDSSTFVFASLRTTPTLQLSIHSIVDFMLTLSKAEKYLCVIKSEKLLFWKRSKLFLGYSLPASKKQKNHQPFSTASLFYWYQISFSNPPSVGWDEKTFSVNWLKTSQNWTNWPNGNRKSSINFLDSNTFPFLGKTWEQNCWTLENFLSLFKKKKYVDRIKSVRHIRLSNSK